MTATATPTSTVTTGWSSLWQFDGNLTIGDPGARHYRWNNDTAPTQLAVSMTDDDGIDRQQQLSALAVGWHVTIRSTSQSSDWVRLVVVAVPATMATWIVLDVAVETVGPLFSRPGNNNRMLFDFVHVDDSGGTTGDVVTPPDQTVWWDLAAVTAKALAQLRLTAGDVDAARVGGFVDVAGELLNTRMDRTGPPTAPVPASWNAAIVDVTVQLYLGKDSPPSDVDLGVALGYMPADPLAPSKPMMAAAKQRWGVG